MFHAGAVYAIPQRAMGVLRVLPSLDPGVPPECTILKAEEQSMHPIDLFEGGVLASDGCIYCIPLRAKSVLKVIPPLTGDSGNEAAPAADWFPETSRFLGSFF